MTDKTPSMPLEPDREAVRDLLQHAPAPSVDAARMAALKHRISRTIAERERRRRWLLPAAAAAAALLFGVWLGRASVSPVESDPDPRTATTGAASSLTDAAAAVQVAGTRYVAAIARLRALRPQGESDEYGNARAVALSAFAAAAWELGVAEDREASTLALGAVLGQGVALSASSTPVVMYR